MRSYATGPAPGQPVYIVDRDQMDPSELSYTDRKRLHTPAGSEIQLIRGGDNGGGSVYRGQREDRRGSF